MYSRLAEQENEFLAPHQISGFSCDIFEETLLKIAGIDTHPHGCLMGAVPGTNEERMFF